MQHFSERGHTNHEIFLVFHEPPIKIGFFSEPQKYQNFLSLTPSHLLKVTKLLVKISQFEFRRTFLFTNFFCC